MKNRILFILLCFFFSACREEEEVLPQTDGAELSGPVTEMPVLKGRLRIKLKAGMQERVNVVKTRSGISSGIDALDLANVDLSVYRMERVFPPAGKFEERHKEAGLDLWYDVYFDEKIPTRSAVGVYDGMSEVECVEEIREARLCDYKVMEEPLEPARSMLQRTRADAGGNDSLPFNDPRLKDMWHYHNAGESVNNLSGAVEGADIGVFGAWNTETGSQDVIVAVMDGGIQSDHPDLKESMWVNEEELNGEDGVDDDNNGYVDDIYGWNYVSAPTTGGGQNQSSKPESGKNGAIVPHLHGTHCAGTIAARNDNGQGICGIAGGNSEGPGVRVMSLQIFQTDPSTGKDLANADPNMYVYAADMGATISTNSWTQGSYEESKFMGSALRAAIDYFIKNAGKKVTGEQDGPMAGGLVIVAADNNNNSTMVWPASYDKVLTVAAINHNFKKSSYSCFGKWVDISAPGGETAYGEQYGILSTGPTSNYVWLQGTSMACPHVTGCAALVLSKFGEIGYTPDDLRERLINSTHNLDEYNTQYKGMLGAGYVDVGVALTPPSTTPPDTSRLVLVDAYDEWAIVEWTVKAASDGPMSKYVLSWRSPSAYSSAAGDDGQDDGGDGVQSKTINVRYMKAGTVIRDTVHGLSLGKTYNFSLKAYDRWGGVSVDSSQVSAVVTENKAPAVSADWNGTVMLDEGSERMVVLNVRDPERQRIECDMTPALDWITVHNVGDTVLTVQMRPDYRSAGKYDIQVRITDQYGKYTTGKMPVEVVYKDVAPVRTKSFADMMLPDNGRRTTIDLTEYFMDPKGRTLMYEVENSSNTVADVRRNGNNLIIEPKFIGHTEVMVRARNGAGLFVGQRFDVEVIRGGDYNPEDALAVYPNPVERTTMLTLQPEYRGEVTVRLYNSVGRLMKAEKVVMGNSGYVLDMSGMQGGTYTVVVEGEMTWKKTIIKI